MNGLREFLAVYASYRRFHGRRYAFRRAWGCTVNHLPF